MNVPDVLNVSEDDNEDAGEYTVVDDDREATRLLMVLLDPATAVIFTRDPSFIGFACNLKLVFSQTSSGVSVEESTPQKQYCPDR